MKLSLTRNCHRPMWLATPPFGRPSWGGGERPLSLPIFPASFSISPPFFRIHHGPSQKRAQWPPTASYFRDLAPLFHPLSTPDFSTRQPPPLPCCCSPFFLCFCVHLSFDNVFVFLCRFRSFSSLFLAFPSLFQPPHPPHVKCSRENPFSPPLLFLPFETRFQFD